MAGNICRCGCYQRIQRRHQARGEGTVMTMTTSQHARSHRERQPPRHSSAASFSTGAFVVAARFVPGIARWLQTDRRGTPCRRRGAPIRSVFLGIDPDGTCTSSRTAPRWAPASAPALPMVAADELDADWSARQDRAGASATSASTATRTPTAREPSATSSSPCAHAAPRRALMLERPRRRVAGAASASARPRTTRSCTSRAAGSSATASWPPRPRRCRPRARAQAQGSRAHFRYIGKGDVNDHGPSDITTGKARLRHGRRCSRNDVRLVERPPVVGGKVASHRRQAQR